MRQVQQVQSARWDLPGQREHLVAQALLKALPVIQQIQKVKFHLGPCSLENAKLLE